MTSWTKTCYSRMLIDNHISEDDPAFMTQFDPVVYVNNVKKAGVQAAMVYACCHNGNCYYPTTVGHMHRNLNGRDIFGETVAQLRREEITPVAYYTTIYHNHSAKNHPTWRMQDIFGKQHQGRYWWSCPNNEEYREFTKKQIAEIIAYPVEGIFIDMTFWPVVCCCPSCRKLYRLETQGEIPNIVDFRDPAWVRFQRFREDSMTRFTSEMAESIKAQKDITVTFQSSTIIMGWGLGQNNGVADSSDYTSGDFYGGKYQHILGTKVLAAASKTVPFEFMTSRCTNLNDHTSMKSEALLTCEAATTLANGGAYFFIDAIDPIGTLDSNVYERLGKVSQTLAPFRKKLEELTPSLDADTALYYSMKSHIDDKLNGSSLQKLFPNPTITFDYNMTPAIEELTGTAVLLAKQHHPFRLIRDDGTPLSGLKTLVLNNVICLSEAELQRLREFVLSGGTLIATGWSSLLAPDGSSSGDFALADLFGVSFTGRSSRRFHFMAFEQDSRQIACSSSAPLVKAVKAQVLARIAEPLFDPDDSEHYASIHSNPPGPSSEYAALTVNRCGLGLCIYLASPVLAQQQDAQQVFGGWLFANYAPSSLISFTNAPAAVEMTLLKSSGADRRLFCCVNYQGELPNVPVHDIVVSLHLPASPNWVTRVSDGKRMTFDWADGMLRLEIPVLETIEMLEIG